MKFKIGEKVIVLNTEHRLAGTGRVMTYHALSGKYKVLFKYPHAINTAEVTIPEERLVIL